MRKKVLMVVILRHRHIKLKHIEKGESTVNGQDVSQYGKQVIVGEFYLEWKILKIVRETVNVPLKAGKN